MNQKILLGVSSCLLGNNVRFNGANSHKSFITKHLAEYFDYQAVCPEVAAGFGVPRPAMFMVSDLTAGNRVVSHKDKGDKTDQLKDGIEKIFSKLPKVYGFILKSKSPSCGVKTARVFNDRHDYTGEKVDGLFVEALRTKYPLMPLEDEGRLNDHNLREAFIKQVYCYYDVQENLMTAKSIEEMMSFHARHKSLLRLHSHATKTLLGNMIANAKKDANLDELKATYEKAFMEAVRKPVKRGHHYMALQNMLRKINPNLSKSERKYVQDVLERYRKSQIPLTVPIELIKFYLIKFDLPYLMNQSYLNPYPDALGLMNHINESLPEV